MLMHTPHFTYGAEDPLAEEKRKNNFDQKEQLKVKFK